MPHDVARNPWRTLSPGVVDYSPQRGLLSPEVQPGTGVNASPSSQPGQYRELLAATDSIPQLAAAIPSRDHEARPTGASPTLTPVRGNRSGLGVPHADAGHPLAAAAAPASRIVATTRLPHTRTVSDRCRRTAELRPLHRLDRDSPAMSRARARAHAQRRAHPGPCQRQLIREYACMHACMHCERLNV